MEQDPQSGESSTYWEEPDITFTRFIGDVSEDDMRRIFAEWQRLIVGKRYTFHLIDLSRMTRLSPEARKVARDVRSESLTRATVMFGASWQLRALLTIFLRAVNLLRGNTDNPVAFFDTDSQARVWLAERRRVIHGGAEKR
jgi:hypothetical protein